MKSYYLTHVKILILKYLILFHFYEISHLFGLLLQKNYYWKYIGKNFYFHCNLHFLLALHKKNEVLHLANQKQIYLNTHLHNRILKIYCRFSWKTTMANVIITPTIWKTRFRKINKSN